MVGVQTGLRPVPDVRAKLVFVEVVGSERLVFVQGNVVEFEPHPEPFAEKETGRVGEELDQFGEGDGAPGCVRFRQCRGGQARPRFRSRRFYRSAL